MEKHALLAVLKGETPAHTPVWIMRQAGRYLPEYIKVRAQAGSFINLYKNKDLACKVTLQPIERFNLDAAILFSDILTIPEALGLELDFIENKGPVFNKKISSLKDINNLPILDINADLNYVFDNIALIKKELHDRVPLIGFTGSPWTLATYMLQGSSAKEFTAIRSLMIDQPNTLHLLLSKLTTIIKEYLLEQIKAGADIVQIFDTWGGILSPDNYQEFSLNYMQEIVNFLNAHPASKATPTILFTKNTSNYLKQLSLTNASCIGLDWTVNLTTARDVLSNKVIQGNLDPCALLASEQAITQQLDKIFATENLQTGGYIFNLGHGIYPQTNPEKVKFLVDKVHQY